MPERSRDEHLDMMAHPDKWPLGFTLPLTMPGTKGENGWPEQGFLRQPKIQTPCPPPEPVVYLGNMYMASGQRISDWPTTTYLSLEQIYDAGWRVD